jgi:SAM-dependent methyltransferase
VTLYDKKFFDDQSSGSIVSAREIVPIVMERYRPSTVVDVGCGIGTWAVVFEESGCRVVGIDGGYVSYEQRLIDNFLEMDLNNPISFPEKFDLAVCLEVAEHLPKSRSEGLVEDLTKLSDRILFSAAIPGQGGTGHINEQPLMFWVKFFYERDYRMRDVLRKDIKDNEKISWWYRQNIVVFERI